MSRIEIAGELSIYQVAILKQQFQQALDQANLDQQAIELDMQQLSEVDGAGLQLLMSLSKSAAEFGVPLHLLSAPPSLCELLDMYGLSSRFLGSAVASRAGSTVEVNHEQ